MFTKNHLPTLRPQIALFREERVCFLQAPSADSTADLHINVTDIAQLNTKTAESLEKRLTAVNDAKYQLETSEKQAQAAVERAVQIATSHIATWSSRTLSRLMFKDQSRLIDKAANEVVKTSEWFNARKNEIGVEFSVKVARAQAMEEVRTEMAKQISEMQEKQTAAKEALLLIQENTRRWQVLKRNGLRYDRFWAMRAARRANKADTIFQKHTEKMDTAMSKIQEMRAKFCTAARIDDATLTKLIAGKEITFRDKTYRTSHEFFADQPVELRSRLQSMFIELKTRRGRQLNDQLRAKQLSEKRNASKEKNAQFETMEVGQTVALTLKDGDKPITYQVMSRSENGVLILVSTEKKKTAPVLIWNKQRGLSTTGNKESNVSSWKIDAAKKEVKKAETKAKKLANAIQQPTDKIQQLTQSIEDKTEEIKQVKISIDYAKDMKGRFVDAAARQKAEQGEKDILQLEREIKALDKERTEVEQSMKPDKTKLTQAQSLLTQKKQILDKAKDAPNAANDPNYALAA